MTLKEYRKLAVLTLKYMPVFTALIMLVDCCLLTFNLRFGYAPALFGLSIGIAIPAWLLSKGLGFCFIHRAFIYYTCIIYMCREFHEWIGMGYLLSPLHYLMLLVGFALFIYFFLNIKTYVNCYKI